MRARQRQRPIFWQRRIDVSAALLCYAKITPASLHRGEYRDRCRRDAEAAVRNPEFELSLTRHRIRGGAAPDENRRAWPQVEQRVPYA
jgi:hypothetical protein